MSEKITASDILLKYTHAMHGTDSDRCRCMEMMYKKLMRLHGAICEFERACDNHPEFSKIGERFRHIFELP
jgi:hypothetical protein